MPREPTARLAVELCQAAFYRADGDAGAGGRCGFDAVFREPVGQGAQVRICRRVADSVSRVACLGLLGASAMVALGKPLVDLIFIGGKFSAGDARECAVYFAVFSISMFLWSAQAIYSRAFMRRGTPWRRWWRGR